MCDSSSGHNLGSLEEFSTLFKKQDKALYKFKKSREADCYTEFKIYRNKAQCEIKKCKSNHFKNQIEENQNNGKKLWDTLKYVGLPTKTKNGKRNPCLKIEKQ